MKRFNGICIITKDIARLVGFYRELLQVDVQQDGDNFSFNVAGAGLTIFSYQGMENMAPRCMEGTGFGGYTIDFEVEDVDLEYKRITGMGISIVKRPLSYPWGSRSTWFRDPDGNLINFFARIQK